MRISRRTFAAALAVWISLGFSSLALAYEFSDWRGLWLNRFEYRNTNEAGLRNMVDQAASLGITDLLFQVRGQGDAYYNGNVEPRAPQAQGWDPLQIAIDQAHSHGMNIHAWINTMPLWNGTTPPQAGTNPPHPFYHQSPSYRVHDLAGNPQPLQSGYVIANPILPEWHDHVNNVVTDIVSQYDVDGVHLDYIRWLGGTSWADLPHDAQSHAMFTNETGLPATSSNANAYRQFVRDRVTDLVSSVKTNLVAEDPDAVLSAAVWRDPDVGSSQVLQEYRTWMQQDLIDVTIPMIYLSESNNNLFLPNLQNVMSIDTNSRVAPGIGVYLHDDPAFTVSQLETLYQNNTGGVTLFGHGSFFASGQLGNDRFNAVKTYLDSVANSTPGPYESITDFEVDEGYFGSSATFSGSNQGINAASADRVTTESFRGVGSQEIVVDGQANGWFLRHVSGIGGIADPSGNLQLTADGYLGVWLKTDAAGLEVSIAVDDPGTADRGLRKALVADGEWHLYEWNLDDSSEWEGWVTGDGLISGVPLTLDSIQFWGEGQATIFMDEVGQNPAGSIWSSFVNGDFDGNGSYDTVDIDDLTSAIAAGSVELTTYDLNNDGIVNIDDVEHWLAEAGEANLGEGRAYLFGDANLDGNVDGSDFLAWNDAKFTNNSSWSSGDFNASGDVDGQDFLVWNNFKFQSADVAAVPEPGWLFLLMVTFLVGWPKLVRVW